MNTTINGKDYHLIKDYKDQAEYRQGLNRLTKKTYGFDFEDWYQQGYWKDRYHPYSFVHQGEIIANVSASNIDFLVDGIRYSAVQIGTVMTEVAYRNQGLSKALINIVIKEFEHTCDLIYLYANDSVLEFYPKFGFTEAKEYSYSRKLMITGQKRKARKLNINEDRDKAILLRLVERSIPVSKIAMIDNNGLLMFYLTSFLSEQLYYIDALDLVAVVEHQNDDMQIIDIFSDHEFDLDLVINSLRNKDTTRVTLGFTPLDTSSYTTSILKEEGTTFFIRGKNILGIGKFPTLSHT
jgi:GNAT superfamily N-acetyltransferase